jgi:hypothetical protein
LSEGRFSKDNRCYLVVALSDFYFKDVEKDIPFGTAPPGIGPVLIVGPWYKPLIGGVAEIAEQLRRLLDNASVETHVLVCEGEE